MKCGRLQHTVTIKHYAFFVKISNWEQLQGDSSLFVWESLTENNCKVILWTCLRAFLRERRVFAVVIWDGGSIVSPKRAPLCCDGWTSNGAFLQTWGTEVFPADESICLLQWPERPEQFSVLLKVSRFSAICEVSVMSYCDQVHPFFHISFNPLVSKSSSVSLAVAS